MKLSRRWRVFKEAREMHQMMDFAGEKSRLAMRARRVWCEIEMDSRRSAWEVEQLTTWRGQVNDLSRRPASQVSRRILSRGNGRKRPALLLNVGLNESRVNG